MTIALILLFAIPTLFLFLVFAMLVAAGGRVYRAGRKTYSELKPYVGEVTARATRASDKVTDFGQRGAKLTEVIDEIGGRWAFITQTFSEVRNSPVLRMADIAGRFVSGREDRA